MFEREDPRIKQEGKGVGNSALPEKRQGPPPQEVLENPRLRQQTGRSVPDVWQDDVTEETIPPPVQREETAHTLRMDPIDS